MKTFNKIILLFFIFSQTLLGKWRVQLESNENMGELMRFITEDDRNKSIMCIDIIPEKLDDLSYVYDNMNMSFIKFFSYRISENSSFRLKIKKNSGNYIDYITSVSDIHYDDYHNEYFLVISGKYDNGTRSNNLIKTLLQSLLVELYDLQSDELLGAFYMKGLKEILVENVGNTRWYKEKIKDSRY